METKIVVPVGAEMSIALKTGEFDRMYQSLIDAGRLVEDEAKHTPKHREYVLDGKIRVKGYIITKLHFYAWEEEVVGIKKDD